MYTAESCVQKTAVAQRERIGRRGRGGPESFTERDELETQSHWKNTTAALYTVA